MDDKRWLDLIVIHELGSLPLYLVVLFPSAFLPPLTHSHRVDGWVGGWVRCHGHVPTIMVSSRRSLPSLLACPPPPPVCPSE